MNNNKQAPVKREIVLLVGVLLLAGLLRAAWPGLTEFKRDEALLLARAFEMVDSGQLALRGISSSTGFPNFPASVWFYALPLTIWDHVYSATLFTGLLNLLAVLGCWWLTRRYWGASAALSAAMLFAVSPWAIFHSQKIWAQNLLAPLVVGWAICAGLALVEGRRWFVLLHLVLLAVAIQLHLAAVALLPATVIFLLVFRRRVSWRLVILGCLAGLLIAGPFIIYLLGQPGSVSSALSEAPGDAGQSLSLRAWRFAWLLGVGREIHALAGPEAFEDYLAQVPDLTLVHLLWTALIIAGAVWMVREFWLQRGQGNRPSEMGFVVLVWLIMPALFFSLPLLPKELHYLLPGLPAQYISAGVAFAVILSYLGRWRPTAWAILTLTVAAQVWIWLSLFSFIGDQYTPGGYGTPIKYHLANAERARSLLARNRGNEVIIAGKSESPETDEFAAIYDVLLRDVNRRYVDVSRSAVFPSEESVILLSQEAHGPGLDAYLSAAESITRLPLRNGEGAMQILALPPSAAPKPQVTVAPPALFANWIRLIGYDELANAADGAARWQIYWHPGDNPDPNDYHFFNHLVDTEGGQLSQQDGPTFNPQGWRAGDTVISYFNLPWPDNKESIWAMRTGLYTYPDLQNVPLIDAAGNPASDAAELLIQRTENSVHNGK